MIGMVLTSIIGVVARGTVAKAIAGAMGGALASQLGPITNVFAGGVVMGATPAVGSLGRLVGEVVIGGAIGYFVTYFAPANKPKV